MFEISTTHAFAAAHQLQLYDGSLEPVHGHNWRVRVTVGSSKLDSIGVVMDFHELERHVEAIVRPWHNSHLNRQPPFYESRSERLILNPTTENIAAHVGRSLEVSGVLPDGVSLVCVDVWETDTCRATYRRSDID